jgi:hypothetical protein
MNNPQGAREALGEGTIHRDVGNIGEIILSFLLISPISLISLLTISP